jgi:predicted ATPase
MLEEHVAQHGLAARRPVASFYCAALAYARDGSSPEIVSALQRAIVDFRNINHLARMPYYLSVVAEALATGGRVDEAETTILMALSLAHEQEERWCLPEVLRIQAAIATAQGKTAEAETMLLEAMTIAEATGALSWRLRAAIDLAKLWRAAWKSGEARNLLLSVLNKFTEGFSTRDLIVAAQLIDQ